MQNISSLSSKRTGKSQIWFTFAGVISQNCVILVNGGEQEEKKFLNTVIVSSAIAQRPSQQWPVSMQALIFSSKALVLRKFGSTNHTLNSIDTRNDTTFFLFVFFKTPPPKKNVFALSQMLIEFAVRSNFIPQISAPLRQQPQVGRSFQFSAGQRHFFWLDLKFPAGKQYLGLVFFLSHVYWWTPHYSPFGIINTMRNGAY